MGYSGVYEFQSTPPRRGRLGTDYFFDGLLWNPRIWARSLSAAEHRMMFERERGLFGV